MRPVCGTQRCRERLSPVTLQTSKGSEDGAVATHSQGPAAWKASWRRPWRTDHPTGFSEMWWRVHLDASGSEMDTQRQESIRIDPEVWCALQCVDGGSILGLQGEKLVSIYPNNCCAEWLAGNSAVNAQQKYFSSVFSSLVTKYEVNIQFMLLPTEVFLP